MKTMIISMFLGLTVFQFPALAQNLSESFSTADRVASMARDLPATVVVRHNHETNEFEVYHSKDNLAASESAIMALASKPFESTKINTPVRGELDRDTSRSSWFFALGVNPFYNLNFGVWPVSYLAPAFYYNNLAFTYSPYFYYNYSPYSYYFYRWF